MRGYVISGFKRLVSYFSLLPMVFKVMKRNLKGQQFEAEVFF